MKRFEYKTIYFGELRKEQSMELSKELLNKHGEDGWELTTVAESIAIFKREITISWKASNETGKVHTNDG